MGNFKDKEPFIPTVQCLRTIQVINVRWFNATAWYGLELSRLLIESGHQTLVLTLNNTEAHHKAVQMGLSPVSLPLTTRCPFIFYKLIQDIQEKISLFKPNIVNCHRGESFILWGLLREKGNYALVRTRGDQRLPKGNFLNKILHRRMTDAIITTNSTMSSYFTSKMQIKPNNIHTILGGIDLQKFSFSEESQEQIRSQYGFKKDQYVIGLLGRFDRVKGQKELIYAISSLIQEGYTSIRLLLIGFSTAVTKEEVEFWIQDAGICSYVTITDYVQDIPAYLSAIDIGVIASLGSEAIARAALEIMACRRPLISTNVGVMPDLLPKEALIQPGSISALADMLRKTLIDESWREWLKDICYKKIQEFDSKKFLSMSLAAYKDALHSRFC